MIFVAVILTIVCLFRPPEWPWYATLAGLLYLFSITVELAMLRKELKTRHHEVHHIGHPGNQDVQW